MRILISYECGVAIYEQIKDEIKRQIVKGELKPDEMLPSIRMLARELKVGIITAKRAYDDLCLEGYLYSHPAKGVFVAKLDMKQVESRGIVEITSKIKDIKQFAMDNLIDKATVTKLLNDIWEDKK